MPLRFMRHSVFLIFLIAVFGSANAADCAKQLIPDLLYPHHDEASDLAYLATISPANFDAHKKNALLDQDPATHPERYHADDPVGLSLPISKAILESSADFEEFNRKREAAYREHHFTYTKEELSDYFERSIQVRRTDAYAKCTKASGFFANVLRSERDFVEVTLGWRPSGDVTETALSKFVVAGATLRGSAPTKLTAKEPKTLLFIRHLNKDFRLSAMVAGAPVNVFVPKYLGSKSDTATLAGQCAAAPKVVDAIYRQILVRSPTPAEIAQQSALLTSGVHNVRQLVELLMIGAEYPKNFVEGKSTEVALTALYIRTLGRDPDKSGFTYNKRMFDSGGYQKIALAFVEGREYLQRFGDWTVPDANPKIRFCPGK
jgi:Phycobilisome Linker polypeptide